MTNREAMEIVLEMAHKSYSKSFGPTEKESEAIHKVEGYMALMEQIFSGFVDNTREDGMIK